MCHASCSKPCAAACLCCQSWRLGSGCSLGLLTRELAERSVKTTGAYILIAPYMHGTGSHIFMCINNYSDDEVLLHFGLKTMQIFHLVS